MADPLSLCFLGLDAFMIQKVLSGSSEPIEVIPKQNITFIFRQNLSPNKWLDVCSKTLLKSKKIKL